MKLFEFVKEFNMLLHPNEAKRPAKETKLQTRANFLYYEFFEKRNQGLPA